MIEDELQLRLNAIGNTRNRLCQCRLSFDIVQDLLGTGTVIFQQT
jgi:hypothetical protein